MNSIRQLARIRLPEREARPVREVPRLHPEASKWVVWILIDLGIFFLGFALGLSV